MVPIRYGVAANDSAQGATVMKKPVRYRTTFTLVLEHEDITPITLSRMIAREFKDRAFEPKGHCKVTATELEWQTIPPGYAR